MAGALQLIARLQAAPVPPVPPCKNSGEPLEAAPLLGVPPVPSVPPPKHEIRKQCTSTDQGGNSLALTVAPPPPPTPAPAPQSALDGEQRGFILTAATATPEWRQRRDRYINHLMACRACYAPAGRYCANGVTLRDQYDNAPMEPPLSCEPLKEPKSA